MPSNFKEPTIITILKRKGERTDFSSHQSGHLCTLHFWTETFWINDHALLESWCDFRLQCDVADLILCGTSDIGNMQVTKLRSPPLHVRMAKGPMGEVRPTQMGPLQDGNTNRLPVVAAYYLPNTRRHLVCNLH